MVFPITAVEIHAVFILGTDLSKKAAVDDKDVVALAMTSTDTISKNFVGPKVWLVTNILSAKREMGSLVGMVNYVLNLQLSESICDKQNVTGVALRDIYSNCFVQYDKTRSKKCTVLISRKADVPIRNNGFQIMAQSCTEKKGKVDFY